MSAYLIVDISVHDADQYMKYVAVAPGYVEKYGGKYLVRGGQVEIVEGSWNPERLVILQFPSMEHARSFLKDPEYQAVAETRRASTTSHLLVAEGFPG